MSDDLGFPGRDGLHEVVRRRWRYAPPPWVMYDAIVDERDRWLMLLPGEAAPTVTRSRRPDLVVLEPSVDPALSSLAITIEADGEGSAATFVGRAEHPELDPHVRRRIHHRLGTTFGAALREWVDEPHR